MRRDIVLFTLFFHLLLLAFLFASATMPTSLPREEGGKTATPVAQIIPPPLMVEEPLLKRGEGVVEVAKKEESPLPTPRERGCETLTEIEVKKGDSLDKLAKQYNISTKELMAYNHLFNDRLSIGQILRLPPQGKVEERRGEREQGAPQGEYYEIRRGDNLWKIAREKNISYKQLIAMNGLNEETARNLQVGDRVRLR